MKFKKLLFEELKQVDFESSYVGGSNESEKDFLNYIESKQVFGVCKPTSVSICFYAFVESVKKGETVLLKNKPRCNDHVESNAGSGSGFVYIVTKLT